MNTDVSWPSLEEAEARVLEIQTKLHQWAKDAPGRRFDDLYNLVCDRAVLVVVHGFGLIGEHGQPGSTRWSRAPSRRRRRRFCRS